MSKKEERELKKRVADLEEEVEDKLQQETANQETSEPQQDAEGIEEQALEAAKDYYEAAAAGNYNYTYDALSSAAQSQFTEEEWVAANTALGSDEGIYNIDATNMVDDSTVVVYLTITAADGSTSERTTQFVLESHVSPVAALVPDKEPDGILTRRCQRRQSTGRSNQPTQRKQSPH